MGKGKMSKKRIVDFNDELSQVNESLINIQGNLEKKRSSVEEDSKQLEELENQLMELGVIVKKSTSEKKNESSFHVLSDIYLKEKYETIEKEVLKEIESNENLLPSLTKLDYLVAFSAGIVASVVDFLLVKIPKDITYLNEFAQDGSKLTAWIKSLGNDEDGKLNAFFSKMEDTFKVSYDASTKKDFGEYASNVEGFYPKTHRMMSLGHDPFFGLIFSLIDIFNGSITFIDAKGAVHYVVLEKFQNQKNADFIFAPFIYIGHLLSDFCTKMGIPVPGWAFTQLLQFGKLGKEKDHTVADLARWMYINGYDLRHFMVMGTVPGIIELLIRIYNQGSSSHADPFSLQYEKELTEIHGNIRLHKLLFIAHAVASSGNVLKVIMYKGNPLSLNIPELLALTKETIRNGQISLRDKTAEKIIRNRDNINKNW